MSDILSQEDIEQLLSGEYETSKDENDYALASKSAEVCNGLLERIKALEAEVKRLREALEAIAYGTIDGDPNADMEDLICMAKVALSEGSE